ncbi:MAG: hypothetical protein KDA41_02770, partial [Planctomycetales bacterium]|nr:hypothetical protein [Planctomycetales bacterium]
MSQNDTNPKRERGNTGNIDSPSLALFEVALFVFSVTLAARNTENGEVMTRRCTQNVTMDQLTQLLPSLALRVSVLAKSATSKLALR